MSRTGNSLRNAITAVLGTIVRMGSRFLTQTVLIYCLGAEYIGLQGFLQNVVGLLSITELGLGVAVVYSLYKVLADADEKHVASIMNLYKQLYWLIGLAVLCIAVVLVPFMPYLVKNLNEFSGFWYAYWLYVVDTLLTYWFFSYRNAILQADQKQYILNLINLGIQASTAIIQVIILYMSHDFLAFICVSIFCKICGNYYLKFCTDHMYPYLLYKNIPTVPSNIISSIKRNVKAIVIYNGGYKINVVLDTMLISYYLNIVTVGKYSNYYLIFSAFTSLINVFFGAFTASLGNLYIKDSPDKNEFIFRCLNLINFILAGVVGVTVAVCLGDFISIWIGSSYRFDSYTHYFLIFTFFSELLGSVILQFRNAYGLFDKGKYRPLIGAILNATISMYLAPKYGVIGITLGTLISSYLTFWWFDSWLIYHYGFHKSVFRYYAQYIFDLVYITAIGSILVYGDMVISAQVTLINLFVKACVTVLIVTILLCLRYYRTPEFQYLIKRIKDMCQTKLSHR